MTTTNVQPSTNCQELNIKLSFFCKVWLMYKYDYEFQIYSIITFSFVKFKTKIFSCFKKY